MAPFTRGTSLAICPRTPPDWNFMTRGGTAARGGDSHGGLMRFENIDDGPEPADIEITWLPKEDGALSFPHAMELARAQGYSCFHEPSVAVLPDERLFVAASSLSGHLIYAVSRDEDATGWREAEPLRYRDDGTELLHPIAPAPLYGLEDGRFLIFYHGHDGRKYGGLSPNDTYARRPMCVSLGEYRPHAHQPIWFSQPTVVCPRRPRASAFFSLFLHPPRGWLRPDIVLSRREMLPLLLYTRKSSS